MKETRIDIDKSFLSLSYDTETDLINGDTSFYVTLQDVGDEPSDNLEIELTADPSILISPNSFTAVPGEPQLIGIRYDGEPLPDGNYNFKISVNNEYAVEKTVNTSIYSAEKNTVNDNVYKLKYFIQRQNYICRFFQLVSPSTTLIPIEINGTCQLDRQEKKDLVEPIIASTLSVKLEASIERDLSEINSSDEKTFKVEMEYLGNIIFSGFVLPDNSWRSWVADKWTIDVKVICGLSTLKSIAFAQKNSTGNNLVNFFGRMSAIEIISNCLEKTGLNLPIYVNCQITYVGIIGWYNILSSIYLSVERYKLTEREPLDCDSVLRSLMQIFGLSIVQEKNAWYIYRPKDLTNPNPLTSDTQQLLFSAFYGPVYQNNLLFTFGDRLGSQINNVTKFHCSENQMIREAPAISANQITYSYGGSKNILTNGGLLWYGTERDSVNGVDMPGWDVLPAPDGANHVLAGAFPGANYGVNTNLYNSGSESLFLQLDQSIDILENDSLILFIRFRNIGFNSTHLRFAFGVIDSSNVYHYYHTSNGTWQTAGTVNEIANYYQPTQSSYKGKGDATFSLEATAPVNGRIFLSFYRNKGTSPDGQYSIHEVSVSASDNNIKSKDYIARKNNAKSTSLKDPITVYNGDSESDLFVGTIYKSDSDTPTIIWSRYYLDSALNVQPLYDNKELLEIIAAEGLSMSPRPMTEFEGDFKGYIDFVNFFTIDGFIKPYSGGAGLTVKKQFQFLKWSYNFDSDTTKMFAREIEESNLSSNEYNVKIYENFGNETKVTIVS